MMIGSGVGEPGTIRFEGGGPPLDLKANRSVGAGTHHGGFARTKGETWATAAKEKKKWESWEEEFVAVRW